MYIKYKNNKTIGVKKTTAYIMSISQNESRRINSRNKKNYGAIIIENQTYNSEFDNTQAIPSTSSSNHDNNNFNRNKSNINNAKRFVISYFERRIQQLQRKDFKIIQFKSHLKMLRKLLHLNKNPKRKGYDEFMSEEDKR